MEHMRALWKRQEEHNARHGLAPVKEMTLDSVAIAGCVILEDGRKFPWVSYIHGSVTFGGDCLDA